MIIRVAFEADSYQVIVVGAGPGGYPAAIRCAQRGLRTLLVERNELGGICLNAGCIPSKSMLYGASLIALAPHARDWGVSVAAAGAQYGQAVEQRERTVAAMRRSLTTLLRGNGVETRVGTASLVDTHRLRIAGPDGESMVGFEHLILATGSHPARPTIPGADLPAVIDSDGALRLAEAPARVVVIGGGAVGVEWAEIWRAYGSEVTVIEALPTLIPTEEPEIGRELARIFARKGISCHVGVMVGAIRETGDGVEVDISVENDTQTFAADTVLLAVGRHPNVANLGLEEAGVIVERGIIQTDDYLSTSVPHIFAVGDVNGRSLLAHSATHQGLIAADVIAGRDPAPFDAREVPGAIFTHPEIASVGIREADATRDGVPVRIGRFPFAANARAITTGDANGYVKILAHGDSHAILGMSIIGPGAADLIATASLAIHLHARLEDLAHTIHVHPTWSEALVEAAWAALDTPIHVPRRRPRVSERTLA
jgi:dihydrolipoamide dehydrogenase